VKVTVKPLGVILGGVAFSVDLGGRRTIKKKNDVASGMSSKRSRYSV